MSKKILATLVLAAVVICACDRKTVKAEKQDDKEHNEMNVKVEEFGEMPDGRIVDMVAMSNGKGLTAKIITYGGIITSFEAPDRNGKPGDIVLGFDNLEGYLKGSPYFGAIIGRYGNRIGKAKFTLDGKEYRLVKNDGENTLHGGEKGFDKVLWKIEKAQVEDGNAVLELSYTSKDGEQGFPGNLKCLVTYTLTADNKLKMHYEATTDKPTVVNMTNHAYWNLAGQDDGDILRHEVMLNADKITAVGEGLIPTGELKDVKGTPFDFTKPMKIGARIKQIDIGGYDHNFVLNGKTGQMKLAAKVYEPTSGRAMEIDTTEPGIQFYTGNFLDGTLKGKGGKVYNKHAAFCLETQHFPDSPNHDNFPSTVLRPGEKYESTTIHTFSTK